MEDAISWCLFGIFWHFSMNGLWCQHPCKALLLEIGRNYLHCHHISWKLYSKLAYLDRYLLNSPTKSEKASYRHKRRVSKQLGESFLKNINFCMFYLSFFIFDIKLPLTFWHLYLIFAQHYQCLSQSLCQRFSWRILIACSSWLLEPFINNWKLLTGKMEKDFNGKYRPYKPSIIGCILNYTS